MNRGVRSGFTKIPQINDTPQAGTTTSNGGRWYNGASGEWEIGGYYKWTTTTKHIVLPAGFYRVNIVSGGSAGGGSAAGNANYTCSLTSVRKPNSSSLEFPALTVLGTVLPSMSVTGSGITPTVLVESVAGDVVYFIATTGSIGTLSASGSYTFTWPNSGGGGAANNPVTMVIRSDGQTAYRATVGAGGTGVSGANGNVGGLTVISGGPDGIYYYAPTTGATYGLAATSSQLGFAGMPSGVTTISAPYDNMDALGAGGQLMYGGYAAGTAAAETPIGGCVGGGAGAANDGANYGGNGGGAGTVIGGGAVGTGNTGTTTGGTGGSAAANSGCGGGGAGGSYAGGSAVAGGNGGSGYIEAWRIG